MEIPVEVKEWKNEIPLEIPVEAKEWKKEIPLDLKVCCSKPF